MERGMGWGFYLYLRRSNPLTYHTLPHDIEEIFAKLNLRKDQGLLFESYHPLITDEYFFNRIKKGLGIYSKFYDKYMLAGDFNARKSEPRLSYFLFEMNSKGIIKEPICFKSLSRPSSIGPVITNTSSNFQNTKAISTGLSDFNKMVVSVLKYTFYRSAPKELVYRDYKNFIRVIFERELDNKLNQKIN